MACNCQENTIGSTQESLVAWVQPSGAGPENDVFYAMTDEDWPGIKITGARKNRRGAITPIFRRSGRNPRESIRAGSRSAAPAANTITLEFAQGGCGGFQPSELVQCLLTVYQQHICCSEGGDFERGWSKIDAFVDIDIESDEYSDGVSYNKEDNNELFIRHTGDLGDKMTFYPLSTAEIAAGGGLDSGAHVRDVIYADLENCGNSCGTKLGCADRWYAITDEGRVIYKKDANTASTSVTITGYSASSVGKLAILGNRLFASHQSGGGAGSYFWTELDSDGDPGTWTQVNLGYTFQSNGFLNTGSRLLLFGHGAGSIPLIFEINSSAGFELVFSATTPTGIIDMAECGKTKMAGGIGGVVWMSGCQETWALAPSTPTATLIRAVDVRANGEWWIGDDSGAVFYTNDGAQSWTEVTFPFSGIGDVQDIVWANSLVGHILANTSGVAEIYTTWNGGKSWINGSGDNDRIVSPPTGETFTRMAVPCCSNSVESSNTFLVAGVITAGTGGLWQGEVFNCG